MKMPLPSFRRLYLFAVLAFTSGSACALCGQTRILIQTIALFTVVLFLLYARNRKFLLNLPVQTWLLLLLSPVIASIYANWRLSVVHDPLQKYANRSIIVLGKLCEKLPSKSQDYDNFSLAIEKVIFPDRQSLYAKTQITIRHAHNEQNATLPLLKLLMFRVQVRSSDDSGHDPYKQTDQHSQANDVQHVPHVFLTCTGADVTIYNTTTFSAPSNCWQPLKEKAQSVIDESRRAIASAHMLALSDEAGSLLTSMVLGDKAIKLPEQLIQNFRTIGLSHIVAASGFNLTLVISMSFFIAGNIFKAERHRALFALALMACFILLAGLSASIVRSGIMCSVLIFSRLQKRKPDLMATLATALLITMIYDPNAVLDLGLQLSYAATLGITCGARPLCDLLQIGPSKLARAVAEVSGACLIAQLSVLPIQVFSFWNANVLFLISNVMVLPLVGPITTVGFASSLIALTSVLLPVTLPLSQFACKAIDSVLSLPIMYVLKTTQYLASLHWAQLRVGKPTLLQVLCYYVLFLVFNIAMRRLWHRAIIFLIPLAAVWVLMLRPPTADLTLGILRTGLIVMNSTHEAAVFPLGQSLDNDRSIEKFLNFCAVRDTLNVVPEKNFADEQTRQHRLRTISAMTAQDSCSIYTDSVTKTAVVYVANPADLTAALSASDRVIGLLGGTETRMLVIRFDSDSQCFKRYKPESICAACAKLMSACGLEQALIICNNHQFINFAPLLENLKSESASPELKMTIIPEKTLQFLTITRAQMLSLQRSAQN